MSQKTNERRFIAGTIINGSGKSKIVKEESERDLMYWF